MKIQYIKKALTLTALSILLVVPIFVFTASYSRAAQNIIDGDLVKTATNPDIYIVKIVGAKKFKRLILNPDIFNSYGHLKWSDVKTAEQATIDEFKPSELVIEVNADGSVADPKVYRVTATPNSDVGERRWLNISAAEFETAGYDWDSMYKVNHREAAPDFYPTKTALTYQEVMGIKQTAPISDKLSITLVAPNKILAGYATNIVIKGYNFKQGVKVDFGSGQTQVVYSFINSEQISVLVPAKMPALTYNLSITNPDGQIAILNDALTLQSAPSVSSTSGGLSEIEIFQKVAPSTALIFTNNFTGAGSGIVLTEDGYILTNQHVVGNNSTVDIYLTDDGYLRQPYKHYTGTVLSQDSNNDLAIVKISATGLHVIEIGSSNSQNLPVGSPVYALGFPLIFDVGASSVKFLSGKIVGTTAQYLQVDVPIQPGNSGGPLVNNKGQLVGISNLCLTSTQAFCLIQGQAFAIAIDYANPFIPSLKAGISPTPTPTPTPQVETLTTSLNTGFAGGTTSSPTGVKGTTGIKIASFILSAGSGEAVAVTQIVLKNNITTGQGLGSDFQNLRLMNGTTQIGTTVGSLSTTASNTYTFTPASAITINAGQQYVVDVYADSLVGAINTGIAYSAVILDSVTATGKSTSVDASWGSSVDMNGQQIYLATGGSLTIVAGSDTPIAQIRSMGQTGQTLATFKLTTGASEAVNITKIVVTDTLSGNSTGAVGSVINLKLFNAAGTQIGSTVASMAAGAIVSFDGLNYQIAKDRSETLTLKGDINGYPNAVSGSTHLFSIAGSSTTHVISAGATTGTQLTGANIVVTSAAGTAQSVYRSELTVANAMSNMSGGAGTLQQVGKYTFTNTSAGNYSITVTDLDLDISSTLSAGTGTVQIRKDSPSGTIIAEHEFTTAVPTSITTWNTTPVVSFTIDANNGTGSVDLYVLVDTANFTPAAAKTISTSIGATGITWSDTTSTGITSLDNAPVYGATVTY